LEGYHWSQTPTLWIVENGDEFDECDLESILKASPSSSSPPFFSYHKVKVKKMDNNVGDCPGINDELDAIGTAVACLSFCCASFLVLVIGQEHYSGNIPLGRRYWSVMLMTSCADLLWSLNFILAFNCDLVLSKTTAQEGDFSSVHIFILTLGMFAAVNPLTSPCNMFIV
jgi:hypothetical protein